MLLEFLDTMLILICSIQVSHIFPAALIALSADVTAVVEIP
jgi:hypothetical protein